jgi:hypothetical protein
VSGKKRGPTPKRKEANARRASGRVTSPDALIQRLDAIDDDNERARQRQWHVDHDRPPQRIDVNIMRDIGVIPHTRTERRLARKYGYQPEN